MFKTDNLTPMQLGRFNAALDRRYNFDGHVKTLRKHFDEIGQAGIIVAKETFDGTIDYNRTKFNRMDHKEQAAYMARLKAKQYYAIGGITVPKIVFDAFKG